MDAVKPTDKLKEDDIKTVLLGLFGEVGSLMSAVKKHRRDTTSYIGYNNAVVEELGDAMWYLAALCRRLNWTFDEIFSASINTGTYETAIAAIDLRNAPISTISIYNNLDDKDEALTKLAISTASLFGLEENSEANKPLVANFIGNFMAILNVTKIPFSLVLQKNIEKVRGTFLEPDISNAQNFDEGFEDFERLPDEFEIHIKQRADGKSYMSYNDVFIGDPLTDNILDEDGYRFHDVFHFAFAAILHWSPTFRALLKKKRKSNRQVDEAQDGGRAIVVEEGLSAWIFAAAKNLNFFEGHDRVSLDILKIVHQFVSGYEVESCSLSLWNKAILDGYKVFRDVKANKGGIILGNRITRTITYRPHEKII